MPFERDRLKQRASSQRANKKTHRGFLGSTGHPHVYPWPSAATKLVSTKRSKVNDRRSRRGVDKLQLPCGHQGPRFRWQMNRTSAQSCSAKRFQRIPINSRARSFLMQLTQLHLLQHIAHIHTLTNSPKFVFSLLAHGSTVTPPPGRAPALWMGHVNIHHYDHNHTKC